ncbi:hypothetical protein ACHHYP_04881, partial [Achlya hypogyna]
MLGVQIVPGPQAPSAVEWVHGNRASRLLAASGVVYAVASVALSVVSVALLSTYMSNNLFWPAFKADGVHRALIDLYTKVLATAGPSAGVTIDLLSPATVLPGTYAPPMPTPLVVYPTYPRTVLYTELTTLEVAVVGIREVERKDIAMMVTQYCWLDFERRWELAHTRRRQARCAASYTKNAAVYLEAVLRNIDYPGWLELYATTFHDTIMVAVAATKNGLQWLTGMAQHTWAPVEVEVALWATVCDRFALQWTNLRQVAVTETITIENSLGFTATVHIKTIPPVNRYAIWSSISMYGALENDIGNFFLGPNATLVLNSPTWFGYSLPAAVEMYNVPYPLNAINQALHDQLGPLGTIDLRMLRPPDSLRDFVTSFERHVAEVKRTTASFAAVLDAVGAGNLHPTPSAWQKPELVFFGGNPMCAFGAPYSFVQESFGFDDTCAAQRPYTISWTSTSALFALSIEDNSWDPCMSSGLSPGEVTMCTQLLASAKNAYALLPTFNGSSTSVAQDVEAVALATLQFVANEQHIGSISVESQLVLPPLTSWRLFGWMAIYEWALGQREAVAFEGDSATFHLLSYRYEAHLQHAEALDVGQSSALYVWAASAYVTIGLCVALVAVLGNVLAHGYTARTGRNWFAFNRIASSAWVGRPVLFVRATAAILCLSTAPVSVGVLTTGGSAFASTPRSLAASCLLAGESLWLSYVLNELLLYVSGPAIRLYVRYTTVAAFLIVLMIDVIWPPQVVATVGRQCIVVQMDFKVICTSGTVRIGHVDRVLLLWVVHAATVMVSLVLCLRATPDTASQLSTILRGSQLRFADLGSTAEGQTTIDWTSLVMGGLLPFHHQGSLYLFDVTLWRLLRASAFSIKESTTAQLLTLPAWQPAPFKESRLLKHASSTFTMDKSHLLFFLNVTLRKRYVRTLWIVTGFAYVVGSLVSNVVYMTVTSRLTLANDLYWG